MWTTSSPWGRRSAWIYEYLLSRNIPEPVASGILYQNALDFFHRNSL